jgi:hypothetical protein
MSAFSVPAQVRQWRSWIHGDIYSEVMGMFLRRKMWLDVDQMLGANPSVGLMPSSFWNFYHGNYAAPSRSLFAGKLISVVIRPRCGAS